MIGKNIVVVKHNHIGQFAAAQPAVLSLEPIVELAGKPGAPVQAVTPAQRFFGELLPHGLRRRFGRQRRRRNTNEQDFRVLLKFIAQRRVSRPGIPDRQIRSRRISWRPAFGPEAVIRKT